MSLSPPVPDTTLSNSISNSAQARKLAWSLALGTALIFLAFLPPGIYSLDGNSMLAVAESVVTNHSVTVPEGLGIPGRGGLIYSSWYPLQSLVALPLVAIASVASRVLHVPFHFIAAAFASILPPVFLAATVGLVAWMALQLGSTLRGARRAALCFAFGTIAMVYSRTFYAEPLLSLLIAGAVCLAFTCLPRKILAVAALALLAVLAKPTGIVLGPALSAYLLLKKIPLRISLLPCVGSAGGLFLYCIYNVIRFGHPFTFGQPWAFSLSAIPTGIAGLLVSPGRGIIWFCPPVLIAIVACWRAARIKKLEVLLIAALFLGMLVLHSFWSFWTGGWGWGPRFLLPVIPGLMAVTGLLEGKFAKALVALSVAGFLVNVPTMISYYERYYAEANEQRVPESLLFWSPSYSPVFHVWGAAWRETSDALHNDVREIFRAAGTPSPTIAGSRALRVVAVWWWVLPIVHIPQWIGAMCALVMIVCGSVIVFRFRVDETNSSA